MTEPVLTPGKSRLQQLIMLAAALTLLTISFFSMTNFLAYRFLTGPLPDLLRAKDLQGPMLVLDESLSMSARLSAATGDPEWEARYHRLKPQLDQAFKEALHLRLGPAYIQAAMQSETANEQRVAMEDRAFELVRQGHLVQAQELLSSDVYQVQKKAYAAGIAEIERLLKQDANAVREHRKVQLEWSLGLAAILTPLLMLGWWLMLRATRRWQAAIVASNKLLTQKAVELEELNNQLDAKVNERTKELKEAVLASMNMMEDAVRHRENTEQAYENLKRGEAQLAVHALELARSNEELERFAYVASHDLQEPLRTVHSYTQLLIRGPAGKGDAKMDEYAAYISEAVYRMKNMIEGVLAYSQISHEQAPTETIDLKSAYLDAIASLDTAIRESSAVVTCGLLPKMAVDVNLFQTLFQNLIGNALKFRGATAPKIDIECHRVDGDWVFSVQDNGIGIPAEYKDRIFGIFQRLHTRDQYPGTGLGLAMCKRIVERMGGRIWVETVPQGSRFVFAIPAEQQMAA